MPKRIECMRVTPEQVESIKLVFTKVFQKGELFLFGSRVDDQKKGGDIDLYIKPKDLSNELFNKKIAFLVALKSQIGDQKIDLVLEPFAPDSLKQEVHKSGVLLCRIL